METSLHTRTKGLSASQNHCRIIKDTISPYAEVVKRYKGHKIVRELRSCIEGRSNMLAFILDDTFAHVPLNIHCTGESTLERWMRPADAKARRVGSSTNLFTCAVMCGEISKPRRQVETARKRRKRSKSTTAVLN